MYIFQTSMLVFETHLEIIFRLLSKEKAVANGHGKNGLYNKGVCMLAYWN